MELVIFELICYLNIHHFFVTIIMKCKNKYYINYEVKP